ncbi:MAG: trypsin-like peptidase domain-containing protein [Pseudobdellovibrionaceae bacterium]
MVKSVMLAIILTLITVQSKARSSEQTKTQQASQALSSELRDASSVPESLRPKGFQKVLAATIRYNNGTGIFISSHGHFLTAAHNMNLFRGEDFPADKVFIHQTEPNGYPDFMKRERIHHLALFNTETLESDFVDIEHGKIIVYGKGYADWDPLYTMRLNRALYQRIIDEGYSKEEDYMIVATGIENTHCVPVAKENLRIGDFAYYIGYPGKEEFNVQGRPFWSSGLVPAFSSGNIVDGLMNTPRGKQLIAATPGILKDKQQQTFYRRAFTSSNSFYSTLDCLPGCSGSGLINASGEVAGIINNGMRSGFEDARGYQSGVIGGANISHIVEKARSQLDQNTFSQVFDCKDK